MVLFIVRWAMNSIGIWVAVRLLGEMSNAGPLVFILAGLVFSVVNTVLRPIVMILALPAVLLTLGLFTLVVNGFMVYVALKLVPGLSMTFGASILAGLIMSLVNYIVHSALELRRA